MKQITLNELEIGKRYYVYFASVNLGDRALLKKVTNYQEYIFEDQEGDPLTLTEDSVENMGITFETLGMPIALTPATLADAAKIIAHLTADEVKFNSKMIGQIIAFNVTEDYLITIPAIFDYYIV